MVDVFKQLDTQIKLHTEAHPEGITILDLTDLPPKLMRIMKLMLREQEMTILELESEMKTLPESDRLSPAELASSLDELTSQFWLICRGEGDHKRYQVNLRYKKGIKAVWSILDERIKEERD